MILIASWSGKRDLNLLAWLYIAVKAATYNADFAFAANLLPT